MSNSKKHKNPPDVKFKSKSGNKYRVHLKINEFVSSLRFSLSLKISLRGAGVILCSFIPLALLLTLVYTALQAPEYVNEIKGAMSDFRLPGYTNDSQTIRFRAETVSGELLYSDFELPKKFIEKDRGEVLLYLNWKTDGMHYGVLANITSQWENYLFMLISLGVSHILLALILIKRRRKLSGSMLKTIDEMAATAGELSASNFDKRLNIAGTKNELRDLAVVINEMLDRLESSYDTQKAFVSDASHELRTPISVIQGYIQILERWGMSDPEVADEAIEAISYETESMRDLVEKLLFLARHDKKTFKLEKEIFDLGSLVNELIRETDMIDSEHEIIDGGTVKAAVLADRNAIKQAVRVFIDNAKKYTPDGGSVTISCDDQGDCVRISVSDTGPGMTREEAVRVFDRFYRTDSARASEKTGHGLGLAIARLIAQSHGGKIAVKTAPGEGSTFRLILPKNIR